MKLWIPILIALTTGCSRVPSPLTPGFKGSVGLPHHGLLTDSLELPRQGDGYAWLNPAGHHFGTTRLVSMIQYAAGQVDKERPGVPLLVGDLSAQKGGRLPAHRSHRTGRDVDLLFFTTTLAGQPIPNPGWVKFGPDGLGQARKGEPFVRIDIERNWLLVKSLLHAPDSHVVWIFVSRPLEALLTEYAMAKGEDPLTIWEAENVMLQPRNALPHDDHFHLRVGCSVEAAVGGCEDGGPRWPWLGPEPSLDWPQDDETISLYVEAASFPPLNGQGVTASR